MALSPSAHLDTFCRDNLPPCELWPHIEMTLDELRYPARLNCASALLDEQVAALGADRPCLISPTQRWTYGELQRRANQVAQVLTENYGLLPGRRVLLRGPNNPWLVAILREGKAGQLGALRRCVSAGEHLPAAVWREFRDATGVGIIDGIGATEMLHVFIAAADDEIRPGSTGRAVPGYRAAILDDDGEPVPDGTAGRLAVIGPTGCRYLTDDRQRDYVDRGWNITGDTYIRDADGYFWFQARSDDMIISSGYNIAGPEVEEVLGGHPDVAECAVVGRPDPDRGMIVHAAVVLAPGVVGDEVKVRELQSYVKQTSAPYKYPRSVEFLDALPRTESGKLQRYKLRTSGVLQ